MCINVSLKGGTDLAKFFSHLRVGGHSHKTNIETSHLLLKREGKDEPGDVSSCAFRADDATYECPAASGTGNGVNL